MVEWSLKAKLKGKTALATPRRDQYIFEDKKQIFNPNSKPTKLKWFINELKILVFNACTIG